MFVARQNGDASRNGRSPRQCKWPLPFCPMRKDEPNNRPTLNQSAMLPYLDTSGPLAHVWSRSTDPEDSNGRALNLNSRPCLILSHLICLSLCSNGSWSTSKYDVPATFQPGRLVSPAPRARVVGPTPERCPNVGPAALVSGIYEPFSRYCTCPLSPLSLSAVPKVGRLQRATKQPSQDSGR